MVAIMHDARGVGLAAPQVGSLRRLVVVMTGEDEPPIALVNPEITWRSEEEEADFEGCLSIGEVSVEVPRAVAIRVRAQDVEGNPVELAPEGFVARVIQHELDHLDGVLILDRTAPEQRREALKALRDGG
jgi:peptide deformylase